MTLTVDATTPYVNVGPAATGTIVDTNVPVLNFDGNSFSVREGMNPTLTVDADIAPKSAAEGRVLTVELVVTEAPADADYVGEHTQTLTLNFNINSGRRATHAFAITDDNIDEVDGTVTVTLPQNVPADTGQDYTVNTSDNVATINVTDDDTPELSISGGAAVTEGDPSDTAVYAEFTLTVQNGVLPKDDLTVALTVADVAGSNFITQEGAPNFTFPEGQMTATFRVPITHDNVAEANGDVRVTFGTPASDQDYRVVSAPGNTATVAVTDNDKTVGFTASGGTTTVDEDDGSETINLTTNFNAPTGDLTVTGTITGGTTNNSDIGTISGTIPAGTQTGTLTVRILEDAVVEGDESFEITLDAPSVTGWGVGSNATHTFVIRANDGTIGLTLSDGSVSGGTEGEGHTYTTLGIRANDDVREDIRFRLHSSHPEDVLLNGVNLQTPPQITLNDGSSVEILNNFRINPDDIAEPQETVTLSLEVIGGSLPAGWVFSNETFTFNIEANGNEIAFTDGLPTGSGAAVTLSEGGTRDLALTLAATGPTPEPITLAVTFSSTDVRLQSGTTVTIPASTSGTVNIPVLVVNDTTPEDAEDVTVMFAIQGTPPTGWREDTDADEYVITIPANDKTFEFMASGGTTTVEESVSGGAATINIETNFAPDGNVDITGTVAGNDGNDIGTISGTIVSGTQAGTLAVQIIDDAVAEVQESFVITLSPVVETSSPATLGWAVGTKNTHTVAVSHSDNTVSLVGADGRIRENGAGAGVPGTATLTVALSNVSPNPVNVQLTLTDDERFPPEDGDLTISGTGWNNTNNTLTIPAGVLSRTLTFSAPNEPGLENDDTNRETLTFSIARADDVTGPPSGWARDTDTDDILGDDVSYILTIIDDDLPSVSLVSDVTSVGEEGTMTFTVEIGSAPEGNVIVNYTIADGSTNPATAGVDYTAAPPTGQLTFPSGSGASQTIEVPILTDTLDEFNETILVTIALASGTGTRESWSIHRHRNDNG